MSFKSTQFVRVAIAWVLGGGCVVFGVLAFILLGYPSLKATVATFIVESTLFLFIFGVVCICSGLYFAMYTFARAKRHYVEILTGKNRVTLEEPLVRQYLEAYWQKQFPFSPIFFELIFRKKSLQIVVDLPFVPPAQRQELLEGIGKDLDELFGRLLGYPHDVHLLAGFQGDG